MKFLTGKTEKTGNLVKLHLSFLLYFGIGTCTRCKYNAVNINKPIALKIKTNTRCSMLVSLIYRVSYTIDIQCLLVYSKQNLAIENSKHSIKGAMVNGPTNLVIKPIKPVRPRNISNEAADNSAPCT